MEREQANLARETEASRGSMSERGADGGTGGARTASDRERGVPSSREGGERTGLARRGRFGGPLALMQQFQEEMDRFFSDFGTGGGLFRSRPFARGLARLREGGSPFGHQLWSPEVDVFRRGDEIVVRADLPGLKKDDVSVDLEEGVLTIRGERREEAEEDREGYYWSERSYGSFERVIPLPDGVDEERAQATFQDGVLEVRVPAPAEEMPTRRRRIEIR